MPLDLMLLGNPRGLRRDRRGRFLKRKRSRRNPRGVAWSGCVSRVRKTKGGRRRRFVRQKCGFGPHAFISAKFIGRRLSGRLQRKCRGRRMRRKCRR